MAGFFDSLVGTAPKLNFVPGGQLDQVLAPGAYQTLDPTQQLIEGLMGSYLGGTGGPGGVFPGYQAPPTGTPPPGYPSLSPLQTMSLDSLSAMLPGAGQPSAGQTGVTELQRLATKGLPDLQGTFQKGIVDPLEMTLTQDILPQVTSALGASEGGPHSTAAGGAMRDIMTNFARTAMSQGAGLATAGTALQEGAAGDLPGAAGTVAAQPLSLVESLLSAGSVPTTFGQQRYATGLNMFGSPLQQYALGTGNIQQGLGDILNLLGTTTTRPGLMAPGTAVVNQGQPGLVQSLLGNQGFGTAVGNAIPWGSIGSGISSLWDTITGGGGASSWLPFTGAAGTASGGAMGALSFL